MTHLDAILCNPFDVARLASLNWQRDGCPPARELDYYREAEKQVEALRNVLAYDRQAVTGTISAKQAPSLECPSIRSKRPQENSQPEAE
jgi:hypothetical protein